jgi:acyl-CoA synthetase (AMP-forming)/AMP-acid ligase II
VNVADLLRASAERHGGRLAVTDVGSGQCLSYGKLAHEAERVTAFLAARGVSRADRIGLLAPNGLAYLPAAFGLLAAGACLVPLPGHLTPTEAAELVRAVELDGWLASPGADLLGDGRRGSPIAGGACDSFVFHRAHRHPAGPAEFPPLNPAFIRFTSGTTAASKGVVLSHQATLARVEAADRVLNLGPDDRILWVLPLAYHFAVTIVAYVKAASHILMCPDTRPAALLDAICRLGPTVLYGSPLHFDRLGHLPSRGRLERVRLALSTSAPLPLAVGERFEARHGVPLGQAYGIIEAGLPAINTGGGDAPAGSLGRPAPGCEIAIVDEDGAPAPAAAIGEIAVRGDGLFSAYYAQWQQRERITGRGGWFLTGDLG